MARQQSSSNELAVAPTDDRRWRNASGSKFTLLAHKAADRVYRPSRIKMPGKGVRSHTRRPPTDSRCEPNKWTGLAGSALNDAHLSNHNRAEALCTGCSRPDRIATRGKAQSSEQWREVRGHRPDDGSIRTLRRVFYSFFFSGQSARCGPLYGVAGCAALVAFVHWQGAQRGVQWRRETKCHRQPRTKFPL